MTGKEELRNITEQTELKISVIICAYTMDRYDDTIEAVESVLAQTLKPHEVILSIDHNEELYKRFKEIYENSNHESNSKNVITEIKVVLNSGIQGLSETRNAGIRCSIGQIIAFLDDDATAESTWLENLVSPFKNANVMAVGGQSIPVWPAGRAPYWFPEEFDHIIGCTAHKKLILQSNGEIRNVTGSNMAFRNYVFEKVGMWETELGAIHGKSRGGEEGNICLRITNEIDNSLIIYKPDAIALHKIIPSRASTWYALGYCWRDGLAKAKMKRSLSRLDNKSIAEEKKFVRKLIFHCVPQRIYRFYKFSNIAQTVFIVVNLSITGTGYVLGRLVYR